MIFIMAKCINKNCINSSGDQLLLNSCMVVAIVAIVVVL